MTQTADPPRWWVPGTQRNAPKMRLFCFPYAGGAAGVFASWSALLPEWIDVWALQMPGRENRLREPPLRSTTAIVEGVMSVPDCFDDLPYALFGYSLGAVVA